MNKVLLRESAESASTSARKCKSDTAMTNAAKSEVEQSIYEGMNGSSVHDSVNMRRLSDIVHGYEVRGGTHPRDVVDMGLKSVRPESTKCCKTSVQSSLESHVILLGESTSTGIT